MCSTETQGRTFLPPSSSFFNIQIEHGNEKVTFETSMMDVAHSFHGCEIAGKLNKSNILERKQQTNIE